MPRNIRESNQLRDMRASLDEAEKAYLRKCGWKYTCDTPGSLWLWARSYKGRALLVPQPMAIHMQECFDSGVYLPDPTPES